MQSITPEYTTCKIIKSGRTTGLTTGELTLNGSSEVAVKTVPANNLDTSTRVIFKSMYEVHSYIPGKMFFQSGDSGSGVFLVDKNEKLHCFGIAIGCTDYGAAIVEPIIPVLKALFGDAYPAKLKEFQQEPMDAS